MIFGYEEYRHGKWEEIFEFSAESDAQAEAYAFEYGRFGKRNFRIVKKHQA